MNGPVRLWVIGLLLTLLGIAIVIGVGALSMSYLRPTIGDAAYAVVFVVALLLSVTIGRVLRWFTGA